MEAPPLCTAARKATKLGMAHTYERKALSSGWAFLGVEESGIHCIVEIYSDEAVKTVADPSQIAAMWHNL